MQVGELQALLDGLDDDYEIFISDSAQSIVPYTWRLVDAEEASGKRLYLFPGENMGTLPGELR